MSIINNLINEYNQLTLDNVIYNLFLNYIAYILTYRLLKAIDSEMKTIFPIISLFVGGYFIYLNINKGDLSLISDTFFYVLLGIFLSGITTIVKLIFNAYQNNTPISFVISILYVLFLPITIIYFIIKNVVMGRKDINYYNHYSKYDEDTYNYFFNGAKD